VARLSGATSSDGLVSIARSASRGLSATSGAVISAHYSPTRERSGRFREAIIGVGDIKFGIASGFPCLMSIEQD
jgi:hypothetical protein